MTRSLTLEDSGIYTGNNLASTDVDKVLSNFATIDSGFIALLSEIGDLSTTVTDLSSQTQFNTGNSRLVKPVSTDAVANAAALRTAYSEAKGFSPSPTNRVTIYVLSGIYDFGTLENGTTGATANLGFVLDTDCIDIIGIGDSDSIVFTSNVANQRALGCGTVRQQVQDVRIHNVTLKITASATSYTPTGTSLDPAAHFLWNPAEGYLLTVSGVAVAPAVGSVYSNNGHNFTVTGSRISAGSGTVSLAANVGRGAPSASGTLTQVSGYGDATIAFSAFSAGGDDSATLFVGGFQAVAGDLDVPNNSYGNQCMLSSQAVQNTLRVDSSKLSDGKTLYAKTIAILAVEVTGATTPPAIGDTYTHNSVTWKVANTFTGASGELIVTGFGTVSSTTPTFTRATGSGDASVSGTCNPDHQHVLIGFWADSALTIPLGTAFTYFITVGWTSVKSLDPTLNCTNNDVGGWYDYAPDTGSGLSGQVWYTALKGSGMDLQYGHLHYSPASIAVRMFGRTELTNVKVVSSDESQALSMRIGCEYSGIYRNCQAGTNAFGCPSTEYPSVASGAFIDCTAGDGSFGGINQDWYSIYQSKASGLFRNCQGGIGAFGATYASGIFLDCRGVSACFSGGYTASLPSYASGFFRNCVADDASFGSAWSPCYTLTVSGVTTTPVRGALYKIAADNRQYEVIFANITANAGTLIVQPLSYAGIGPYPLNPAAAALTKVSGTGDTTLNYSACVRSLIPIPAARNYSHYGNASGYFQDCKATNNSFGAGLASGLFVDCEASIANFAYWGTASGTFLRCRAQGSNYGGVVASGVFIECYAHDNGFGQGGTASGLFIDCVGYQTSFGAGGTFSGTAINCIGGDGSFGGGLSSGSRNATPATGKLIGCVLANFKLEIAFGDVPGFSETFLGAHAANIFTTLGVSWWKGTFTGKMERCSWRVTGTDQECLYVGANAQVLDSILVANGAGKSIEGAGGTTAYIAGCKMNNGISSNVTNGMATADTQGNTIDTHIA